MPSALFKINSVIKIVFSNYYEYGTKIRNVLSFFQGTARDIDSRIKILNEDIEDSLMHSKSFSMDKEVYSKILEDLHKASIENNNQIHEILEVMNYVAVEDLKVKPVSLNIIDLLINAGFDKKKIKTTSISLLLSRYLYYDEFNGSFYQPYITNLFKNVFLYLNEKGSIKEVTLSKIHNLDNKIPCEQSSFLIYILAANHKDNKSEIETGTLTKSQTWASLNKVKLDFYYSSNNTAIKLNIPICLGTKHMQ